MEVSQLGQIASNRVVFERVPSLFTYGPFRSLEWIGQYDPGKFVPYVIKITFHSMLATVVGSFCTVLLDGARSHFRSIYIFQWINANSWGHLRAMARLMPGLPVCRYWHGSSCPAKEWKFPDYFAPGSESSRERIARVLWASSLLGVNWLVRVKAVNLCKLGSQGFSQSLVFIFPLSGLKVTTPTRVVRFSWNFDTMYVTLTCFTVKTSHCQNVPSSKRPKVKTSPVRTSLHGQNVPSQIVPILR